MDRQLFQSAWPLLKDGKVEAIEWSFDALYKVEKIPNWFVSFIQEFSNADRLIGHGVYFSLFSGRWLPEQERWLTRLKKLSKNFTFDHVTEHFGFMTGIDFHKGAPISVPFNPTTLTLGRDRLSRIQDACNCPVGLENLALSYSLDEVKKHGDFLNELITPINGFIILDLHNLYCQLHNFDCSFEDVINLYPLNRVREIHISGGSWQSSSILPQRNVRRDTHDDAVPEEVFRLLQKTIPLCPQLKYVTLEQLGHSLTGEESQTQFQEDFMRMDKIVKQAQVDEIAPNNFMPATNNIPLKPVEDQKLHIEQMVLTEILEHAANTSDAKRLLQRSMLAQSEWKIEEWNPYMLETVMRIAQKWKDGF